MRARVAATVSTVAFVTCLPIVAAPDAHAATAGADVFVGARASAPVVLTGAQIPQWAAPAAVGVAAPYPSGSPKGDGGDSVRSAHNGILTVPPTPAGVTQVDPDTVAAYKWTGSDWQQIPVQVDQRFPYFLANGHSSFGVYSGTDEELTYAWAPDKHDVGEEAWKKVFGGVPGTNDANPCTARYQLPGAAGTAEYAKAVASGVVTPPTDPGIAPDDYTQAMQDPQPLFDTDDELSFMARDAGPMAPLSTRPPAGTDPGGQTVAISDPTAPQDGSAPVGYVYLFTQPGGSSFTVTQDANGQVSSNSGYVVMQRDADADEWQDRYSYDEGSPDAIGTSNTGYGPNIGGTVCRTGQPLDPAHRNGYPNVADGMPRASSDRTPRDGMTVTTPTYELHARGRWLVNSLRVAHPGTPGDYGPNLISRWKGRAFQQSPDSSVSLVGFEDEQVNWENNSALLGWRNGPVRAIREVWGADSGTNVTKTETYYRDADVYAYHLRVHPIPPDGLYTDWDYRYGAVDTYYNMKQQAGVPIDGTNAHSTGEVDNVAGQPAYANSCDPTFDVCSAVLNPEEIAGPNGGLVYEFEMTGATGAAGNAAVVPYYRDDACFDDGTGDSPVPRPYPGESTTDPRVEQGYVDYWHARGMPVTGNLATDYAQLKCQPDKVNDPNTPAWQKMPFQGAIGQQGVHFFFTQDSDNTFSPKNTDEVDGQQWRFEVPMNTSTNVMSDYGANVSTKLVAAVAPYGQTPALPVPGTDVPEVPAAVLLPAIGGVVVWLVLRRRRRSTGEQDGDS